MVFFEQADQTHEPEDIFRFLISKEIGQKYSLFYEGYTTFLELRGKYGKAMEQYNRGIKFEAQPLDRLQVYSIT